MSNAVSAADFIERLIRWMKEHPGAPVAAVCAVVKPVNDGTRDFYSKGRVYTYMANASDLLAGSINLIEAGETVHAQNTCQCDACEALAEKFKAGKAALSFAPVEDDAIGATKGNA
jgi:hypothetical protein